jgi:hypothetical protein
MSNIDDRIAKLQDRLAAVLIDLRKIDKSAEWRDVARNLVDMTKVVEGGSAKDYIDDFIDSDAPQFKGRSKAKRIEMALAAHYGS